MGLKSLGSQTGFFLGPGTTHDVLRITDIIDFNLDIKSDREKK